MESNYEKQVYIARKLFLNYDQEGMIQKFSLACDTDWIYLDSLNTIYRVSRKNGEIGYRLKGGQDRWLSCLDYQAVMILYDVLCYSRPMPTLSGQWCPTHALQVTMSSPGTDTFTAKYAEMFSARAREVMEACRILGGVQPQIRAGADVCWEFPVFPFFPVQMRFWDGDDEFKPKIQLLWDKNALDFMHFETTYYVQGYLLERLAELLTLAEGKFSDLPEDAGYN